MIFAGKASLEEIDRYWTLEDLVAANELLDAVDDAAEGERDRRP